MPARAKIRDHLSRGVRLGAGSEAEERGDVPLPIDGGHTHADGVVDAGDVLPGFRCVVRRIFD
jgi:hypothetical protein